MNGASLQRRQRFTYTAIGAMASMIVRVAIRLRVDGAERIPDGEPALLVANHVSHFDPVVLAVIAHRRGRQVRLVAVQEVFDKPVIGPVVRAIGWIPVSGASDAKAIVNAQAALARGDLVLIYPEGTIPAPGVIVPARPGAAAIAIRARVPAIPIASDGLGAGAGPRTWRRRLVTVRIGSPIGYARLEAAAAGTGFAAASELLLGAVRGLAGTGRPRPEDGGRS